MGPSSQQYRPARYSADIQCHHVLRLQHSTIFTFTSCYLELNATSSNLLHDYLHRSIMQPTRYLRHLHTISITKPLGVPSLGRV
jgi:hypothetical protein